MLLSVNCVVTCSAGCVLQPRPRNYSTIFDEGWYMSGQIELSSVVARHEAAMTEAVQS